MRVVEFANTFSWPEKSWDFRKMPEGHRKSRNFNFSLSGFFIVVNSNIKP